MANREHQFRNAPGEENRLWRFVCALFARARRASFSFQILQRRVGGFKRLLEFRVKLYRPLVDMSFATAIIGQGRREVMALIESGEILWAWNLALRVEGSPYIRIYAQSIIDYLEKRPAPKIDDELQFELITHQIFRGYSKTIRANRLKIALGVGSDHVHKLWHAGNFRTVPGSRCFEGTGGSPTFELSSAIEFLWKRRIA